MEIEVRIEGKKGKIEVRPDGSFVVCTINGKREPTAKEKAALASTVLTIHRQHQDSFKNLPKDPRDADAPASPRTDVEVKPE